MNRPTTPRSGDERGAVLALFALSVVGLMTMVALVTDLAQLRVDRRHNKSVADVAARAGVSRLEHGPWPGVCKARDYVLGNAVHFSSFDPGSERWSDGSDPAVSHTTDPCASPASAPYTSKCSGNSPATWAGLRATALGGRVSVEIRSGYVLPDPRFPDDAARADDGGDPAQGSCDNLAVIITEHRAPVFGRIVRPGGWTTTVRSVGRLNATVNLDYVAALLLLEQHKCDVLQVGGSNTRVVSRALGEHPGTIQIDSAGDAGSCPQPILNAQATSAGPSVAACSAVSLLDVCPPGLGQAKSRIGIYALNFNRPASDVATPYPSTYGDTPAVPSPRSGRGTVDRRYRANLTALDADARSVLTGNAGLPPGCTVVVANSCSGSGRNWLVLQQADCNSLATFFLLPERLAAQNVWFHCDLNVNTPLTLSAPSSFVVVTGQLTVSSSFTVSDPRKIYVGGRATGNRIGLDVGGATSLLSVNPGTSPTCATRTGPGHAAVLVVGSGSLNVASGATARLCQTFVYLASGFDKLPAADATAPCSNPCSGYSGTLSVASNAFADWSAPNEIVDRQPEAAELATTNRYEDLALWTEAGGNTNGLNGGSTTSLTGIYFMPNADAFNLAGNGSLPINLSAQFIATSLKVTGGAVVNLVPNPHDSIAMVVYSTLMVR